MEEISGTKYNEYISNVRNYQGKPAKREIDAFNFLVDKVKISNRDKLRRTVLIGETRKAIDQTLNELRRKYPELERPCK